MRITLLGAAMFLSACDEQLQPVPVNADGGNAYAAWEGANGRRLEAFEWGGSARNQVADYLIVLDNSVSMDKVIDRVRAGFASLKPEMFPPEARIAVMSTLPGRERERQPVRGPLRFDLHPAVGSRDVYKHDPGFLRLVDDEGIRTLRSARPDVADRFPLDGCDAWFAPGAVNAAGQPCIVAHTQGLLASAHSEAGLTAFRQLLERHTGTPIFRPGAAVNVIFVSDTHDPGVSRKAADLLADRPTAAELAELVDRDNVVSSLRFHAIAPETECVERWFGFGPAYFEAAEATGGAVLDLCTAQDYRPILEKAFDEGARPTRPRFALGAEVEQVDDVRVDGTSTSWTLTGTGRVVELELPPSPAGAALQVVEVDYKKRVKPTQTPRVQRAVRAP
jgi:hypothetical protein